MDRKKCWEVDTLTKRNRPTKHQNYQKQSKTSFQLKEKKRIAKRYKQSKGKSKSKEIDILIMTMETHREKQNDL